MKKNNKFFVVIREYFLYRILSSRYAILDHEAICFFVFVCKRDKRGFWYFGVVYHHESWSE